MFAVSSHCPWSRLAVEVGEDVGGGGAPFAYPAFGIFTFSPFGACLICAFV